MQFDIRVGSIYAIIKKVENKTFEFDCKKRSHDGFLYILNGKGYFENKHCKETLSKNTVIILQKDEPYYIKALDNGFEYITTALKILPSGWVDTLDAPSVIHLDSQSYIGTLAQQMHDTWEKRASLYTMKTRLIIEQLIINLLEETSKSVFSSKSETRLSPALDYINQHYDKPMSTESLASLCNLSVSHFRRIFKENLGVSPMQYRETIRIYWAKQFLKSDFFTVSEIATKLGYYDIYHFSKEFKKSTQKSPLEYKKDKL